MITINLINTIDHLYNLDLIYQFILVSPEKKSDAAPCCITLIPMFVTFLVYETSITWIYAVRWKIYSFYGAVN